MAKKKSKKSQFGHLNPEYKYVLNPEAEHRYTKCPNCDKPNKLRKFALLIHIGKSDEPHFTILGYTARFCPMCEIMIIHQNDLEMELTNMMMTKKQPELIGADYMILGTVDRNYWRKKMKAGGSGSFEELLDYTADFRDRLYYEIQPAGWYFNGDK